MKVILPCAGKGTRLGLPYPKEVHLIAEQTALIDLTFLRLQNFADSISEVIVIISPEKALLIEYLQKWRNDFYIKFIYFDDRNFEWAGSIMSAEKEFGEKNVVFLPDSFLVGLPEYPVIPTMNATLDEAAASFGYLPCLAPEILQHLGALLVEGGRVKGFCDKPALTEARGFNAFWTTFGFTGEIGRDLLQLMTRSIQREAVDVSSVSTEVAAFPVQEYKDLGVWPNLLEFNKKMESSGIVFPEF